MSYIQNYLVDPKTTASIEIRKEDRKYSVDVKLTNGMTYNIPPVGAKRLFYYDLKDVLQTIYKRTVYVFRFLDNIDNKENAVNLKSSETHKIPDGVQLFL
jgi:hypothetical protein